MRKTVALGLAICLGLATLAAQQATFKSGTQVVSVFTTVTDAQKRLVPDLVQDDFEVLDNEKPQPLVFFENQVQPRNPRVAKLRVRTKSGAPKAPFAVFGVSVSLHSVTPSPYEAQQQESRGEQRQAGWLWDRVGARGRNDT